MNLTPYHHGNLRTALVEQGLVLLEASDQADLSLRELARRVGVSANAAYRHFANKDALLAALAAEGFRRFNVTQIRAATGEVDQASSFRQAGRAYVQFAQDNPALFRLMFGRSTAKEETEELKQASQASFETLKMAVAQLAGLPIDDPQVTVKAMIAWSLVHGLSHLALDGRLDHLGEGANAVIDQIISHLDKP